MKRNVTILVLVLGSVATSTAWAQSVSGRIRTPGGAGIGMGEVTITPEEQKEGMARRCREALDAAIKYLADKEYYSALEKLQIAGKIAVTEELRREVRQLLTQIGNVADKALTVAQAKYKAKQFSEALDELRYISRAYAVFPAGKKARQLMQDAQYDPECIRVLAEEKALRIEKRIEVILASAQKETAATSRPSIHTPASQPTSGPTVHATLLRPTDEILREESRVERIRALPISQAVRVLDLLETLQKRHGETTCGKAAAADLTLLQADPEFVAKVKAAEHAAAAKGALNKAEMYYQAGAMAKSIEYFKALIRNYPQTEEAKIARKRILEIEVELGE